MHASPIKQAKPIQTELSPATTATLLDRLQFNVHANLDSILRASGTIHIMDAFPAQPVLNTKNQNQENPIQPNRAFASQFPRSNIHLEPPKQKQLERPTQRIGDARDENRAGGRRYLLLHPGDVVRGHAAHLLLRQPQHLRIHHLGGGGAAREIEIGAGGRLGVGSSGFGASFFFSFFFSLFLFNAAGQELNLYLLANKKGGASSRRRKRIRTPSPSEGRARRAGLGAWASLGTTRQCYSQMGLLTWCGGPGRRSTLGLVWMLSYLLQSMCVGVD